MEEGYRRCREKEEEYFRRGGRGGEEVGSQEGEEGL